MCSKFLLFLFIYLFILFLLCIYIYVYYFVFFFFLSEYKNQRDTDYIPLSTCGATEFGVMPLDKFMRAPKSMAERAAEFRQNMLFGTRIRRGPGGFG